MDYNPMRHFSTLPVGERGGNEPLYPELLFGRFDEIQRLKYVINVNDRS
jgi:hypothetical protein